MQTLSPFDPVRPQRARLALLAAAALAAASPVWAQETERASLDPSGAEFPVGVTANAQAAVDIDDKGNRCCFYAVPNGGAMTLYIRNTPIGATTVLRNGVAGYGLAMSGTGNGVVWSTAGSISGFPSFLDPGDNNGTNDIYLFPTDLSAPIWVSVSASGGAANKPSWDPDISEYGDVVTFSTYSGSNMTANPSPPGGQQVYLRDIALGETKLLSITPGGSGGNGSSGFPQISDTGRYVAFQSDASDLVPGDTNNQTDIFVWDDLLDTLTLVSRTDLGAQANHSCVRPSISADGRFVLYGSRAGNLSALSQFGKDSLYVLDRDPDGDGDLVNTNGVTTMVSVNSLGVPVYGSFLGGVPFGMRLSDDGTQVLFHRPGYGLEPNPTGFFQVWLHDRTTGQTTNVHVDSNGLPANHSAEFSIALAGDGSRAVYLTLASNLDLVLPDTNGQRDVYAHGPCENPATQLGFWLAGTGGKSPEFSVCGSLGPGGTAQFRLRSARPGALAHLRVSPVAVNLPLCSSRIVPGGGEYLPARPSVKGPPLPPPTPPRPHPLMLTTGASGEATVIFSGSDVPYDVYAQWVIDDPGGCAGKSLSNALLIHVGP